QTHGQQGDDIEQYEHAAAVFPGDIGELPDVADADGTASAHQQEAQPGAKGFSFHSGSLFLLFLCPLFQLHRRRTRLEFWPPKPKALVMAALMVLVSVSRSSGRSTPGIDRL